MNLQWRSVLSALLASVALILTGCSSQLASAPKQPLRNTIGFVVVQSMDDNRPITDAHYRELWAELQRQGLVRADDVWVRDPSRAARSYPVTLDQRGSLVVGMPGEKISVRSLSRESVAHWAGPAIAGHRNIGAPTVDRLPNHVNDPYENTRVRNAPYPAPGSERQGHRDYTPPATPAPSANAFSAHPTSTPPAPAVPISQPTPRESD